MPLTQSQEKWVLNWIKDRLKGVCPMCSSKLEKSHIGDNLTVSSYTLGQMQTSLGSSSPMAKQFVPIVCDDCAYTVILSHDVVAKKAQP